MNEKNKKEENITCSEERMQREDYEDSYNRQGYDANWNEYNN